MNFHMVTLEPRQQPFGHREFCVYRYTDADGRELYVGSTAHLADRTAVHRLQSVWFADVHTQTVTFYGSLLDAQTAEAKAIAALAPAYNKRVGYALLDRPHPTPTGGPFSRHVGELFIVNPHRFVARGGKFVPWSTPA